MMLCNGEENCLRVLQRQNEVYNLLLQFGLKHKNLELAREYLNLDPMERIEKEEYYLKKIREANEEDGA